MTTIHTLRGAADAARRTGVHLTAEESGQVECSLSAVANIIGLAVTTIADVADPDDDLRGARDALTLARAELLRTTELLDAAEFRTERRQTSRVRASADDQVAS
jgi:hypothetical protein